MHKLNPSDSNLGKSSAVRIRIPFLSYYLNFLVKNKSTYVLVWFESSSYLMLFPSIVKENTLFVEEKKKKMVKISYLAANRKSKRKKKDVRSLSLIDIMSHLSLMPVPPL